MKIIKSFLTESFSPDKSYEERIVRLLALFGAAAMIVALIFDFIIDESPVEMIMLLAMIILVPVVSTISIRTGKVEWGARLQVMAVVFIVLPVTFYFGGGTMGGGIFWIAFAYMFAGAALSGAWRNVMIASITAIAFIEYLSVYFGYASVYPHSYNSSVIDSLVSIVLTGLIIYALEQFQRYIFNIENKKAREETARAEELNRSQNQFFSSMSHEIRTPINSILGLNELILREEGINEKVKNDAHNIQGAGKMLLALINDILDVSKIQAGKMDIIPVNYKVGELVSEIVNMIWLKAEEKGLKLQVKVDPSIPSELFGDEVRIRQILINLLNNAVKYTKEGSVTLHMECRNKKEDSVFLTIYVSDTGIGIKPDAIPYLFDSFQRVDEENNRKIEGTGLGLSIVKQLVDLMDGKIDVDSVYNSGSTFTVEVKQGISNPEPIGEINIANYGFASAGEKYVCGFKAPSARVLIVDDNEMNLTVERGLLADTDMTIDTALSGESALSYTLANRYDAILMDHLMPQMDGIECLKNIRRQVGGLNNQIPVIVLTANAGSENREIYRIRGFDDYLVKPVSGIQLEEMLLKYLPHTKVSRIREDLESRGMNTVRRYSRKLPLIITASSMCDLPEYVIDSLPIDIIPFTIYTENGIFKDNVDAVADELIRYIEDDNTELRSSPPTVEEFEEFFAEKLATVHHIIHITLTTGMSKEYERASKAAEKFGNVTVVNSEKMSSADGLVVMLAGIMAAQNEPVERILSEIAYVRDKVHCSFILGGVEYMRKSGYIGALAYKLFSSLNMRPSLKVSGDRFGVDRIWAGNLKKNYMRYIHRALPRTADPDLNVLFVTYAVLPEDDLVWIEEEIRKIAAFKHIIFQKASAAISLNCGPGTFGLLYMDKGRRAWHMDSILQVGGESRDADDTTDDVTDNMTDDAALRTWDNELVTDLSLNAETHLEEPLWYETIEGIDGKAAVKNSGSEASFKTVLQIFYDSIEMKSSEIEGYYQSGDLNNYTIRVHALKSSARLVGALALGDDAERMENAGKTEDLDYIRAHHDELMQEYRSYREKLGTVCGKDSAGSKEDTRPVADRPIMEAFYDMLNEAAEAMDTDALEQSFLEMKDYRIPKEDEDLFKQLEEAFKSFDYGKLQTVLSSRNSGS